MDTITQTQIDVIDKNFKLLDKNAKEDRQRIDNILKTLDNIIENISKEEKTKEIEEIQE